MLVPAKIQTFLLPTINCFESNESSCFPNIFQMTQQTTKFEDIINEMKINTKTKFNLKNCANPNCGNPFGYGSTLKECISCGAKYCDDCIKLCSKCQEYVCIFCTCVKYDSYEDIETCPKCSSD